MNTKTLFVGIAVGAISLSLATPAAAAKCWNGAAVKAAKIRDLQTILMVGALQCRASGHDVLTHYNSFIKTHRKAIAAHNGVLKSHFKRSGYARGYDRFATSLANGRSVDAVAPNFCEKTAALAKRLSSASRVEVEQTANQVAPRPRGIGKTCS